MNKYICFLFIVFCSPTSYAQKATWAFGSGSNAGDVAYVTKVAPNGNIYTGGKFTGTMDLDPGSGTYNITSNGKDDIYLACYAPSGSFFMGF